ncbi:hypothetical protein Y1Q_0023334 [Alligator mississippiensis]|uniref:Uncharacterized protein n=1 Tax=Alligator mississippiensis TaxID=8496 RepID=A0A151NPN2_ALLMI|nr:hypothetical protein Y1Q_0023334 [Alligator mississippiensis]
MVPAAASGDHLQMLVVVSVASLGPLLVGDAPEPLAGSRELGKLRGFARNKEEQQERQRFKYLTPQYIGTAIETTGQV